MEEKFSVACDVCMFLGSEELLSCGTHIFHFFCVVRVVQFIHFDGVCNISMVHCIVHDDVDA